MRPTLYALAVVLAAMLITTTSALAGSGVGATFNLGQTNTVNATSTLSGNPAANPLFRLIGSGTAATIRADSTSGIAVNGISTSGTGQFGQSTSGIGLQGVHSGNTGSASGVFGQTNSTDPSSAGVTGRNLAGGPGLQSIVTGNAVPPLKINSNAKVASLNSDLLDGLDSTGLPYWKLGGNAGTTPGTNFLGTTDNKAVEVKVNGVRALRLEPAADGPNLIGGYFQNGNGTGSGAFSLTIAGGGGLFGANTASDNYDTVGGGFSNIAGSLDGDPGNASSATIGGGDNNTASGQRSTVSGGDNNLASQLESTVAGGGGNQATGFFSFVGGGSSNTASGAWSFAAGRRAKATQDGSFVWGDSTDADVTSIAPNSFTVRASGGTYIQGSANVESGALTTAFVAIPDGATTPSVSGGNVLETNNANTTTITDFTGDDLGQTITVIFLDSNTTVQDNANMNLNGNFVSTPDDTLTLVSVSGEWFELSRSVN